MDIGVDQMPEPVHNADNPKDEQDPDGPLKPVRRPVVLYGCLLLSSALFLPVALLPPRRIAHQWVFGDNTRQLIGSLCLYLGFLGGTGYLVHATLRTHLSPQASRGTRQCAYTFVAMLLLIAVAGAVAPLLNELDEKHDIEMRRLHEADKCPGCGEYALKWGFLGPPTLSFSGGTNTYYICTACRRAYARANRRYYLQDLSGEQKDRLLSDIRR